MELPHDLKRITEPTPPVVRIMDLAAIFLGALVGTGIISGVTILILSIG